MISNYNTFLIDRLEIEQDTEILYQYEVKHSKMHVAIKIKISSFLVKHIIQLSILIRCINAITSIT